MHFLKLNKEFRHGQWQEEVGWGRRQPGGGGVQVERGLVRREPLIGLLLLRPATSFRT